MRSCPGTVAPYLAEALRAGGIAIAIASDAHRGAFQAGLETAGFDVGRALADGTLISRDSSEALALFMSDGRIDHDAFRDTIGRIVSDASLRSGPVHVYGEMVSVLWEAGAIPAVIELEELWHELGGSVRFSLMCGYRNSSVSSFRSPDALDRICALHSIVHPGRAAYRSFPAGLDGPRAARHFIVGVLRDWGYTEDLLDEAKLVISELATNAVVHAGTPFRVDAGIEDGDVRVSVRDESPEVPQFVGAGSGVPAHGHGLRVVAAVAQDWGVEARADGKTVWAKLRP